jgi:hypothetical protein
VTHFAVFGYHVTGSTGTFFLYSIVTGALALAGLSVLQAGAQRTSRRGREARRGLAQSRRETAAVSADRDDLRGQHDTARGYTASTPGDDGTARNGSDPALRGPSQFARRPAPPPAARSQRHWPARLPPVPPPPVPAVKLQMLFLPPPASAPAG